MKSNINKKILSLLLVVISVLTIVVPVKAAITSKYSFLCSNNDTSENAWFSSAPHTQAEADILSAKLDEVYAELNLDDLDLFHQYLAIYNYVTTNVHYDLAANGATGYGTLYNSLILHRGVCGDFAAAFYKIAIGAKEYSGYTKSKVSDLANNVDGVGGFYYRKNGVLYGHEWNIVKFEDYWYIVDTSDYDFMVAYGNDGGSFFNIDHLDADKETDAFKAAHPMAKADLDTKKYGMTKTFLGYNYPNFNLSVSYDCTKGVVVTWQDAPLKNGNMPIAYELGDYTTTKDTGKKCGNFPLNYAYVHSADDTEDRKYQYTSTYEAKDGVYTMYIKNADFTDEILDFMNNNNGSEYGFWLQAWDSDHNYCYSDYVCQNIFYQPKGYHTKGDLVNSKAATCTSTGYKQYACKDCDALITETTAKVPHTYDSGKTIKEPTCTEKGTKSYTCTVCGSSKTEDISPLGHNYVAKVTKDATCTTGGVITYTCSRCDSSYVEYTNALGHNYSTSKVVKEPTCTEKGISTYYCSRCDSTETKDVNALGHKWDNGVKQEDGSILYTCERDDCGFTRTQEFTGETYNLITNSSHSVKIPIDNKANGTKLVVQNANNSQKGDFIFVYDINTDTYEILNAYDDSKALDIPGGKAVLGSKIQQYDRNNSDAQKWYISKNQNGSYTISPYLNKNLCLDICYGNDVVGNSLQLYNNNGSSAQSFVVEEKAPLTVDNNIVEDIPSSNTSIEESETKETVSYGYKISSALGVSINLRNSKKKSAVLTVSPKTPGEIEDFDFILNSNGTYTIVNTHSNMVLDVAGASACLGTKVQQYISNGSDAQQWVLQDAGNGYYYIISKCNGLALDISKGSKANGTNLQVYTLNKSKAQKFKLEKVKHLYCNDIIENGDYTIDVTNSNHGFSLRVNNASLKDNVKITTGRTTNAYYNVFNFKYDNNTRSYIVTNKATNKVLDVAGGSKDNKSYVQQYTSNDSLAQRWILVKNENGTYGLENQGNGLYLDICSNNTNAGAKLWTYKGNGSSAQSFKLNKADGLCETDDEYNLINNIQNQGEDNIYIISSVLDNSKVLDVKSGSTDNKANVQIYSSNNSDAQKFKFEYNANKKAYRIINVNSGKALDAVNGSCANKTNVQQYKINNSTDAQYWVLYNVSTISGVQYFVIYNLANGLCLDIAGGNNKNGTNIQCYESNSSNAQKFILNPVTPVSNVD